MTNNDELALKLKAAAEMATPGEWERGDDKHGGELLVYCDDALGSAVCESTSTYNSIPKLQQISNLTFIATANPANILALLAERDADKKRIAELEARTLSVKLPKRKAAEDYVDDNFNNSDLAAIYNACRWQCQVKIIDACTEAGIKLEVGE